MKNYNNMDNVDKLLHRVAEFSWNPTDIANMKPKTRRDRIEDLIQAQWFLQQLEMIYIDEHDKEKTEATILLRDEYIRNINEILDN